MSATSVPPPTDGPRATGHAFAPVDWALFAGIAGIWGASFLFIAIGLEAFSPGVVTLLRVGLGALTLNLLPGPRIRVDPADRLRVVALSVLWVGIPFTLFPIAEQHITSAVTGLLNGAMPLFTALFAALFFGTRTSGVQLVGVGVGFLGVVAISIPSAGEGSSEAWGVALVVLATVCYGLAINIAAPLQARYGSRPLMARMLLLATLWTLPYGLVGIPSSSLALAPVVAVAVLGLVGTGLAFLIMGTLVGRVGSTRASFITYLIPVVALVLGVVVQDEEVAPLALLGVVLVIGGALLASRAERPRPAPPGAPHDGGPGAGHPARP
ncbi:DMT family transporter [Iamia majanohamensis]|uniref:DMT family transporter n=1 Tax=Iamia majanohamensis TaxID=467976 RepID=A0AAF0BU30_9ACTN|nr:DMT family transporter [Iamia majanohamensis]WCO67402.1 DMT family transporter [Iamia majanohamensis]